MNGVAYTALNASLDFYFEKHFINHPVKMVSVYMVRYMLVSLSLCVLAESGAPSEAEPHLRLPKALLKEE